MLARVEREQDHNCGGSGDRLLATLIYGGRQGRKLGGELDIRSNLFLISHLIWPCDLYRSLPN